MDELWKRNSSKERKTLYEILDWIELDHSKRKRHSRVRDQSGLKQGGMNELFSSRGGQEERMCERSWP